MGESEKRKIRILVAKPGLDGHDRGAKVVAQALKEAGMEVIYTGLHQTIDQIVQTALQEDVDVIGLSILSGAHVPICEAILQKVKEKGMNDVKVAVGGVIPKRDVEKLRSLGIDAVFPGGASFDRIVEGIREIARK